MRLLYLFLICAGLFCVLTAGFNIVQLNASRQQMLDRMRELPSSGPTRGRGLPQASPISVSKPFGARTQGAGRQFGARTGVDETQQVAAVFAGAGNYSPEALLQIPRINLSAPLVAGVDEKILDVAAGRLEGSPDYGAGGNVAIAAHRDTYFRRLGELVVGDSLVIRTPASNYIYSVRATFVVEPTDVFVLGPSSKSLITLVTCYPFSYVGPAPKRFVVRGELIDRVELTEARHLYIPETGDRYETL